MGIQVNDIATWQEIEVSIPWFFTDNGFSTPIPLRLFRGPLAIIATRYSPIEARVGRIHDWLYWYGRLPGCPLGIDCLTREQRDAIAGFILAEFGYHRTGATVAWALHVGGQRAYDRAMSRMHIDGHYRYQDYILTKTAEIKDT